MSTRIRKPKTPPKALRRFTEGVGSGEAAIAAGDRGRWGGGRRGEEAERSRCEDEDLCRGFRKTIEPDRFEPG